MESYSRRFGSPQVRALVEQAGAADERAHTVSTRVEDDASVDAYEMFGGFRAATKEAVGNRDA